MQIFVSDTEYSMSVKGRGTVGVAIGDGVHTVMLARLSSGVLGWLCEGCKGDGLVPGDRFKPGQRPCCGRCHGSGIRVEYADVDSATVAVRRYLEERTLAPEDLAELRAEQSQQWWAVNGELAGQVRAAMGHARFLRRLIHALDRGRLWSPRQISTARGMMQSLADPPPSRFCGQINDKIEFTGVLVYTGTTSAVRDARMYTATVAGDGENEGCVFRMIGHARALQALRGFDGDRVRMSGTVKEHRESLRVKRTWISHPKLLQHIQEVSDEQQGWPGELHTESRGGVATVRRVRDGNHAYNLLATLFSELRHGPVTRAVLYIEGQEEVVFTPEDVIGDDRERRYAALLADDFGNDQEDGDEQD